MKYHGSLISVKDINVSRKFYEELFALKVASDFGINISFCDAFSLQQDFAKLAEFPEDSVMYKTHNFELYFEEEDLDSFILRMKEYGNVTLLHDVREYPWGQRVIRIYDPDMHIVEIGESMACVIKRFVGQGLSIEETAKRTQHPVEFVKACIGK